MKSKEFQTVANSLPVPTSLILSQFELSDDSDDSSSRKFSGSQTKNYKVNFMI